MISKKLDIIIPVYNEGANIINTLNAISRYINFDHNVYICYDFDGDTTIFSIEKSIHHKLINKKIFFIKNKSHGAHSAVMTGISYSNSKFCVVLPADDDYNIINFPIILKIMSDKKIDILCPDRFMKGGKVVNGPFFKFLLAKAANLSLYYIANLPTKDATNGFRFFSNRNIKDISIESKSGFTYSIEYLVKGISKNYKIISFPATWIERSIGKSRFRVIKWAKSYLKWYFIAIFNNLFRVHEK